MNMMGYQLTRARQHKRLIPKIERRKVGKPCKLTGKKVEKLLAMREEGDSAKKIAKFFNVSDSTVYNTIRRVGGPFQERYSQNRKVKQRVIDRRTQIVDFYEKGVSVTDIAAQLGICRPTIYNDLRIMGISLRGPVKSVNATRLHAIQVLVQNGWDLKDIASALGVTVARVKSLHDLTMDASSQEELSKACA